MSRHRWDNDLADAELSGDVCGVHGPRTAESEHHEIPGIQALGSGNRTDRIRHLCIGDAQNAERGSVGGKLERFGEFGVDCLLGTGQVQLHGAAKEIVGIDPAEHDVGVGHGRFTTTLPIADRARLGAGALRSDVDTAIGIAAGQAAASGPDLLDVEQPRS